VFSIPILLRVYFKYDRGLLTELCHCASESLEIFFRTVLGFPDGIQGLVMVIRTFGDYARFHPHLPAEESIARVTLHIPEKGNKPMSQENGRKNLLKIRKELTEFLRKEKRKVFSGRKKG